MDLPLVVVLGATGNTGHSLVTALAEEGSLRVRTATRANEAPTSMPHMPFDWYDGTTHAAALDGADRLYLLAPVGEPDPARVIEPFLDAALAAGVRRVVFLSSSAIQCGEPGLGEVDALVREVCPEWFTLRPSWFMQNFVGDHPLARGIRSDRRIVTATGDGRLGFVDAEDVGRCAAALLAAEEWDNGEAILTGPETLSYAGAAAIVSSQIGSNVEHVAVTAEAYTALLVEAGYQEPFARALAALDERISSGAQDHVTESVQNITKAKPRSFHDFMKAYGYLL